MIIACDTSSVVCSVAVSHNGSILFERKDEGGQIHIEKLSPFLKEALNYCIASGHEPEALAIAIGPGSFNGLRIGLATMKALAVSRKLPLIPVPTTDAMAFSLADSLEGNVRGVIFSHRNFVHYADYDLSEKKAIVTPEFHYKTWDHLPNPGIDNYFGKVDRGFRDWLQEGEGKTIQDKFFEVDASAASIARVAESRIEEGIMDLDDLEPLYNAQYEAKKWVAPQF